MKVVVTLKFVDTASPISVQDISHPMETISVLLLISMPKHVRIVCVHAIKDMNIITI